jgi:phage gp45-like
VRRLEHWGLRGRPPARGIRSFWIRIGASNVVVVGIGGTGGYGPGDLDEGETALFNITNALVRLWKTGKVTINADTADVVVNDGTLAVARETDPVQMTPILGGGALALWMQQVEGYINSATPGTVTPLSTTFNANPGLTIKSGAPHFKG